MLAACAGGDSSGSSFGGLSTASASSPSGGDGSGTGTVGGASTGADDPTSGGVDASSDASGALTSAGDETTGAPVPNPDGLPSGSECTDPAECMTENCYKIPLPVDGLPSGLCSVCDADADCVALGLGTACTVDAETLAAKCTYGNLGSFCESQAACQKDLICAQLVPGSDGLLPHVCSECFADADCGGGGLRCVPVIDVAKYSGVKRCAVPGSVGQGGLCPLPDGDGMCVTSKCAVLNIAGLFDVGVCGQCKVDADCAMGQTCTPPKYADGFVPASCA